MTNKIVDLTRAVLALLPDPIAKEVVIVLGTLTAIAEVVVVTVDVPDTAKVIVGVLVAVAAAIGARGNVKQLVK